MELQQKNTKNYTEFPLIKKPWKRGIKTLAVVYPNLYSGAVYCLAPLIIYNLVNCLQGWICKRQTLDQHEDLSKFSLVCFTLQYEPDAFNIIKLIKKYKPKITFAGGPVINQNPNILKNYLDFFILGEAEEILPKILGVYSIYNDKLNSKEEFLKAISKFHGVYVPKYSKEISYTAVEDLNKFPYPLYQPLPKELAKEFVFGSSFLLEIERGCPSSCKFCPLGHLHKKPKYRSLENLKQIIDQGIQLNKRNKVVIYSPSFTHPDKKEILKYLISKNLKFSIPSIKVEYIDKELLRLIKKGGQKTLTIAPEANESIRKEIGKFIPDEKFFEFAKIAKSLNFEGIKAYFMLGLPEQTAKDLDEMIIFIEKLKSIFPNLHVSINPFTPKPNTIFSNHKFNKALIKQQASYLKRRLKNIKYKISGISSAYEEYKLATSVVS